MPVPDGPQDQARRLGLATRLTLFVRYSYRQLKDTAHAEGHDAYRDLHQSSHLHLRSSATLVSQASRTLVLELNVLRHQPVRRLHPRPRSGPFVEHFSRRAESRHCSTSTQCWLECWPRPSASPGESARAAPPALHRPGGHGGGAVRWGGPGAGGGGGRWPGRHPPAGRAVALLRFADGRRIRLQAPLAGRPRQLQCSGGVAQTQMPGLDLRRLTVLEQDGYGWVELRRAPARQDRSQVRRYHYRQGSARLLYTLNGSRSSTSASDRSVGTSRCWWTWRRCSTPGRRWAAPSYSAGDPLPRRRWTSRSAELGLPPQPGFGENGTVLDMGGWW